MDTLTNFGNRFALELVGGAGVVANLETGNYFELANAAAVEVCRVLIDTVSVDEARRTLEKRLGVSSLQASELLRSIQTELNQSVNRSDPPGSLKYHCLPDGIHTFEEDGTTIFSIDRNAQTVALSVEIDRLKGPLRLYLQAIVPKLLAMLDIPILHGSACRLAGDLVAFSGVSGAGKTTLARAFGEAGVHVISEDLLLMNLRGDTPSIFLDGEPFARNWACATAERWQASSPPDRKASFRELAGAAEGALSPLAGIWFVDARRRAGTDLQLRALSPLKGLLSLLGNGFLATNDAASWRAFLRGSRLIAETVRLTEATLPDGVGHLKAAVRAYTEKTAS